jgi:hypothetical protein
MRRSGLAAALLLWAAPVLAQTPRGVSPRLAQVLGRADTTAIVWVIARPGTDLARLASDIAARGATVRRTSQFVHAVSAIVPGNRVTSLAGIAGVVRVQPVGSYFRRPPRTAPPAAAAVLPARAGGPAAGAQAADTLYGPGAWVARQLNLPELHTRGLRGAGVRLAMLDAGFDTQHPFMSLARVIAQRDFVYDDSVVRDQPGETQGEMEHGTETWSLIAANVPGFMFGVAPGADFILAKTEYTPTETRTEEDNWVAALEWAVGLGAQIVSSSLGYLSFDNGFTYTAAMRNGDIAVTTVAADSAAKRGVLVVVAVGNDGPAPTSLGTPADADSIVAVGATDSLRAVASFSSRGPTGDGRIKPEVVAPGVFVPIAGPGGLTLGSGTSFATPLVAGLAALVQSVRGTLPAADLRAGLLQASDSAGRPGNTRGYGIPDALKLYVFPTGVSLAAPDAGPLPTVAPTFRWRVEGPPADAGPTTYRLKIALDSTLSRLVLDTTVATTSLAPPTPLASGLRIWWRVVASNALGVVESTTVRGPSLSPAWVSLLTLASSAGASIRDSLPRFVWSSPPVPTPPGPWLYDVDVYPSSRGPGLAVASARGLADTTFQPTTPLERNLPFRWRVVAHLRGDSEIVTSPGAFVVLDESAPAATLLFQNFPNPFPNPATGLSTTCIWFDVAQAGEVRLEIFDLRGRLVRRLAPTADVPAQLPAGRYGRPATAAPGTCDPRFAWDGRGDDGGYVRAGVYVYRLSAPGFSGSRRLVFQGHP